MNTQLKNLELGGNKTLSISLPKDLTYSLEKVKRGDSWPSIIINRTTDNVDNQFQVHLFLNQADETEFDSEDVRRLVLLQYCKEYESGSVEKNSNIKKYQADRDVFYCTFTDASFKDEEKDKLGKFRHIIIALSVDQEYEFTAMALVNSVKGIDRDIFLSFMGSIEILTKNK